MCRVPRAVRSSGPCQGGSHPRPPRFAVPLHPGAADHPDCEAPGQAASGGFTHLCAGCCFLCNPGECGAIGLRLLSDCGTVLSDDSVVWLWCCLSDFGAVLLWCCPVTASSDCGAVCLTVVLSDCGAVCLTVALAGVAAALWRIRRARHTQVSIF